jgi:hypothetical protein
MNIKALYREPLLHFLLIGAAIFIFYSATRDLDNEMPGRIVVNDGQVEQLTANFERTWRRKPTGSELKARLDRNDPQVRQRLRMKLEFILEDLSAQNVTDEKLSVFLAQNPDLFRTETQVAFQQVYINPDKHNSLETAVAAMLQDLNSGVSPEQVGDSTLLPVAYRLSTESEIKRNFGTEFVRNMITLQSGDWTGPISSGYGMHLIKVRERRDPYLPPLAEIRPKVEMEYIAKVRTELKEVAYRKLRAKYEVRVESANRFPDSLGDTKTTAQMDADV